MKTSQNLMSEFNKTRTENLDMAYKSTKNKNLDLFALMGGMKNNKDDFMTLFFDAWHEDPTLALGNLFYLRDIRAGIGLRDIFRLGTLYVAKRDIDKFQNIIHLIPEYGRWDDILVFLDDKVPSRAMNLYSDAFYRNDQERYEKYLEDLAANVTTINTSTLFPHEIIRDYLSDEAPEDHKISFMESQWQSLDRTPTPTNTIVVRDGSGSMFGDPLDIATALAILFSEQIQGPFKDKFITFSKEPEFVDLSHLSSLRDKLDYMDRFDDYLNTNIEKVYKLILQASIGLDDKDLMDKVTIISDMEFDIAYDPIDVDMSTYESIKKARIKMPEIVFWNVDARSIHFPTADKDKVKLISGYSTHVLKDILNDTTTSAEEYMMGVLDKYKIVTDLYFES